MEPITETFTKSELVLEPRKKISLPQVMVDAPLLTSLSDRICASTSNDRVLVFVFGSYKYSEKDTRKQVRYAVNNVGKNVVTS